MPTVNDDDGSLLENRRQQQPISSGESFCLALIQTTCDYDDLPVLRSTNLWLSVIIPACPSFLCVLVLALPLALIADAPGVLFVQTYSQKKMLRDIWHDHL